MTTIRSPELQRDIAEGVTRLLEETEGLQPIATSVIFQETRLQDRFVTERSYATMAMFTPDSSD